MKLISMKLSSKEKKDDAPQAVGDRPDFPYGLRLRLEKSELSKLGIEPLPDVGVKFEIHASAEVIGTSQSAGKNHDSSSIELQITALYLEEQVEKDPAQMSDKEYESYRRKRRAAKEPA